MEEELWHIFECEGTKKLWEIILENRIWNLDLIIGIQRLTWDRDTENFHKIWAYVSKVKESGSRH
jgi:hypothetical protein